MDPPPSLKLLVEAPVSRKKRTDRHPAYRPTLSESEAPQEEHGVPRPLTHTIILLPGSGIEVSGPRIDQLR
jgi:hypothetical protein